MTVKTRSRTRGNELPANQQYRESSVINIDSSEDESANRGSQISNRNEPHKESHEIGRNDQHDEKHNIDQDGDYELDSEYVTTETHILNPPLSLPGPHKSESGLQQPPQDDTCAPEEQQPEHVDEEGEYGDTEDNGDDGEGSENEVDDENDKTYVNEEDDIDEEVENWKTAELKKIDANITATQKRVSELTAKKANAEKRVGDKDAQYNKEWDARNKGMTELEKITNLKEVAEKQVKSTADDLQKAERRLADHRQRRDAVSGDPRGEYLAALESRRIRIPRNRTEERHYAPEDLDEGDDSLSDQIAAEAVKQRQRKKKEKKEKEGEKKKDKNGDESEEDEDGNNAKKKDYARACRRCRLKKKKCAMNPNHTSCANCANEGKRCRLTDHVTGKQIHVNELQDTQAKLAAALDELVRYRAMSRTSVGLDNPLSGITGYGPSTQERARQNWARMVRGLTPLSPLPVQVDSSRSTSVKRTSTANTNDDDDEPSQPAKRQKTSKTVPSQKEYSFQNQTVESYGTSKRGRKPGQTTTRTARRTNRQQQQQAVPPTPTTVEQNQQTEPPAFEFTFECPHLPAEDLTTHPAQAPTPEEPLSNAASVKFTKLWWANKISDRGGNLPTDVLYLPGWPKWADNTNMKQELWFNGLYELERQIPLMEGKDINHDGGLEPLWPGWTRVDEELNDVHKKWLLWRVCVESEIHESCNEEGIGQGTVDWDFHKKESEERRNAEDSEYIDTYVPNGVAQG